MFFPVVFYLLAGLNCDIAAPALLFFFFSSDRKQMDKYHTLFV